MQKYNIDRVQVDLSIDVNKNIASVAHYNKLSVLYMVTMGVGAWSMAFSAKTAC